MEDYNAVFEDALVFAHQLHQKQRRKGTNVPYVTHLIGVAALVGDHGGTQEQVIAALLHDALEDQAHHYDGDLEQEIATRYGELVRQMVLALSDTVTHPKPPWKARKDAYLAHIDSTPDDAPYLLVSVCDKLYNARTLLRDMRHVKMTVFDRFKATPEQTVWYYRQLSDRFGKKHWPTPLQQQVSVALTQVVDQIEALHEQLTT